MYAIRICGYNVLQWVNASDWPEKKYPELGFNPDGPMFET